MKLFSLPLIIFLIWPLLPTGAAGSSGGTVIYNNGQKHIIDKTDKCFEIISHGAASLLENANDVPRMILSDDLINAIKETDSSVEVNFDPPKKIKVKISDTTFNISSILVPLSGKFSNELILFANPNYKAENIYINSSDTNIRNNIKDCLSHIDG